MFSFEHEASGELSRIFSHAEYGLVIRQSHVEDTMRGSNVVVLFLGSLEA